MTPPVMAWIGIGANLGDTAATLRAAIAALGEVGGVRLLQSSSLYRSTPMGPGVEGQPDYINAVVGVHTALTPAALLDVLFAVELHFGRQRSVRNAARTLDLDLLLYGEQVIDQPGLQVPHPRMHERAFVLLPLAEVAPDTLIPGLGRVGTLALQLPDQGVTRLSG
ncbi:2-amino-4-hydroxy-6-hydroxymethyldihydropteridine diphosphokinase [Uliginosibacterium gangwonense]|uniref:2-amino-4-hydroxy-6- hydroxymethyldihydropteridine diphosphokinase n=1 Tax=Uliginosibacterium gangwonense TaxID=392736 RepID=UPI0004772250|nr:2-amino-4-hydroxy-6-hydroxymethyldihydropteridine diphosphokinase [Uliginosibacterium gangwonense]